MGVEISVALVVNRFSITPSTCTLPPVPAASLRGHQGAQTPHLPWERPAWAGGCCSLRPTGRAAGCEGPGLREQHARLPRQPRPRAARPQAAAVGPAHPVRVSGGPSCAHASCLPHHPPNVGVPSVCLPQILRPECSQGGHRKQSLAQEGERVSLPRGCEPTLVTFTERRACGGHASLTPLPPPRRS